MAMYDAERVFNDPFLSDFSTGYGDPALVADQIFPQTDVALPSGKYRVFDRSNWLLFDDIRAPGTPANEVRGAVWSSDSYKVKEHALASVVTEEEEQNYNAAVGNAQATLNAGIEPFLDATELVTRSILFRYEKNAADMARNLSLYPAANKVTLTGTTQWDLYAQAASKPLDTIITGNRVIKTATGFDANTLILPWDVATYLPMHPTILARYQYFATGPPSMAPNAAALGQVVAALTGINFTNIIIADSRYNTNDTPEAGENMVKFWGKDVIMAYVDPTAGQRTKTWAKTFQQPYPNGRTRNVDRWWDNDIKSWKVRAAYRYDIKLVTNTAAYIIASAVS